MSRWQPTGKKRRARAASDRAALGRAGAHHAALRDAAGRTHLRLYTDPNTGRDFVGLRQPLFAEAWQNELATQVANTSHEALRPAVNLQEVVRVTREAMDATAAMAEGFLAQAPAGALGCKSGCDHCCYQSVGVTPAEALTIQQHLLHSRSAADLEQLRSKVAGARERTRGLSAAERYSPEHPCAFLEDARCSIYEVRPLSCRGMNSLDARECAKDLRDPQARAAFVASGAAGHSYLEPIRAFHAVSAGLQLAFSELFQLDMRPLDLIAAIDELLGSQSAIQDWLEGRPALSVARGGDSSSSVQIRELSGTIVTT